MALRLCGLAADAFGTGLDIWPSLGRVAKQTNKYVHIYGGTGLVIPFLASSDVFKLVEEILIHSDDRVSLRFVDSQMQQSSMVAVTGSVIATVAISGLDLKYLSSVPWIAKSFMLASLIASLFCVYYAIRQQRTLGSLNTADGIKEWLRAPPERVRCRNKNRPSISAVLILDTPRALVAMASITFLIGYSIYMVFVYKRDLDSDSGIEDSKYVMVTYFVALWCCIALYARADLFNYYNDKDRTWLDLVMMWITITGLFKGDLDDGSDEPAEQPPPLGPVVVPQLPVNEPRPAIPGRGQLSRARTKKQDPDVSEPSISTALREVVQARQRAVEADQRFVRALDCYEENHVRKHTVNIASEMIK